MKVLAMIVAAGVLAGGWMFSPAEESAGHPVFRFREESFPMAPRLQSSFNTNFQMGRFFRYTVSVGELLSYHLDVAEYQDEDGATRRAIIHIPNDGAESESTISTDPYTLRRNAWNDLSRSVVEHTSEQAMFTGWWDNMQRLHLHTGRRGRPRYPDADVYTLPEQTAFWEKVAGGLLHNDALSCLSRQFLTVADEALAGISGCAWHEEDGPVFLLVSTDDLAHIQEISHLAGRSIPLETRLFSSAGDIHGVVTSVNAWAGQGGGTGSYLVHPAPGFAVRAWKVMDKDFEDSLLIRLLPFSSSLNRDLPAGLKLVYQSASGAYLKIYEISRIR